jgi:hypothetical protein
MGELTEFRNPDHPWPDRPEVPERVIEEYDPFAEEDDDDDDDEVTDEDVDEENTLMLRRQCLFRWAAHSVAIAMSELPEVEKVAAFGAVAQPLIWEVPRFRQFRRRKIKILHECADLDLAVWTTDLTRLKPLKKALNRSATQNTPYGGVAHHQVDVHIFDASGAYRGRLCSFGECPKPGKRECFVPGCGAQPFLQQFEGYRFNLAKFRGEPKVVLFDRAKAFLVRPPRLEEAKPTKVVPRAPDPDPTPAPPSKEERMQQMLEEAWIGDAVLCLHARIKILEDGGIDSEKFVRMTSNRFLSTVGEASEVEAEIGRVYRSEGLDAAFRWIETHLTPHFEKQEANRLKRGGG